jgi:hypothetical protein
MTLECPGCRQFTEIDERETLAKLDSNYPSQRVIVNCKCGETQFVLEAKRGQGGDRKISVRN